MSILEQGLFFKLYFCQPHTSKYPTHGDDIVQELEMNNVQRHAAAHDV